MAGAEGRILELPYSASPRAAEVIARVGRSEDVRFSPDNRRLALAAFNHHRVTVCNVEVAGPGAPPGVRLTGGVELVSAAFKHPHGLDFLNENTLLVASRDGGIAMVHVPPGSPEFAVHEVEAIQPWSSTDDSLVHSPGSVAAVPVADDRHEVLVCHNYAHTVSRHLLERRDGQTRVVDGAVLLSRWLDLPDGIAVSPDGRWLAVSNHNPHNVLLYERSASLGPASMPDGILRGALYPHGLRFTPDGRHLVVADAGAPYLHVFAPGSDGWRGVHAPLSFSVMDDETFGKGSHCPQEGGPKGVDIDRSGRLAVVTSEHQPLAFFDLSLLLADAAGTRDTALDLEHEMFLMDEQRAIGAHLQEARSVIEGMKNSLSWRITRRVRTLEWLWKALTGKRP